MLKANPECEARVLLITPTRKDGEVTCRLLATAGVPHLLCQDLRQLSQELRRGAGAIVLTEKCFVTTGIRDVLNTLQQQEAWSDLPVIALLQGGVAGPAAAPVLARLANVTVLECPATVQTVVGAIQAALRARRRQYQIREQFEMIREAESRMRELQERFEFAIDASELGVFHCPVPLGKLYWNDRCKAHFWLQPDATIDIDRFYALLHPDDRERVRQAVQASVYRDRPYDIEYRVVSPAGETRWIRATGRTYFNSAGQPTRFDGTTLDITRHKAAEKALRETQERFQAMANSIPQLAWMARADGWIFWYNQRWHDYCGTTDEQMQGWGWRDLHDPVELPRVMQKWQDALNRGEPWEDTFPLRRHDGEFRWHLSRASPFRDSAGAIQVWFGTNTDVTEQRQSALERQRLLESEQAARREAERSSRIKDEFLATLSHELRTPLSAIYGWVQLLKMGSPDAATVAEAVEVIDRNVRAQTQLIQDLLDMSRVISGKLRLDVQPVELSDVILAALEAVKPAMDAKGILLEKVIDPCVGAVSGDFDRLQQVLWNLLANAVKFTPKNGRIHVLAERVHSHVEVSVTDTGEGIEPDFLPHLFERFSQADAAINRKHSGLGLGLSIVKNLVELHGGTIRAESPGRGLGATFVVRLPLRVAKSGDELGARPGAASPMPISEHTAHNLNGVKVLVVDDEPDARELVSRFLLGSAAIPALAASAAEAEELIATFRPDVIVSDIGMPGRDGYELMRTIRKSGVKTPAIALTAFARSEDRIRSIESGFQAHLAKPVEPAELLATIVCLHVGAPLN